MSDLSATTPPTNESVPAADDTVSLWARARKGWARVQDWFAIQTVPVKAFVIAVIVLIPLTATYSLAIVQKQAELAQQVKIMGADAMPDAASAIDAKLPLAFGTGSLLGFIEQNPVDRITVIYKPLMWNVSDRIVVIQSGGKQYAYYPSDMETKIFSDRAVNAPWGSKLTFVPRADLDARS
ncbi:MAG TPA: AAA family ATPase, partial [Ramlibacter sp.]